MQQNPGRYIDIFQVMPVIFIWTVIVETTFIGFEHINLIFQFKYTVKLK